MDHSSMRGHAMRFTDFRRALLPLIVLFLIAGSAAAQSSEDGERPRRIALWGSSVPNGTGDELNLGGYTGRLRELLQPWGWEVLNVSRGGDNTITITPRFEPEGEPDPGTRYLTPVDPGYVVIALSLGNEGIMRCPPGQPSPRCADSREAADAVAQQFADGLQRLIARARDHGIVPVIGLTYTRGDFNEAEYAHTRATNLLINTWDVPSVNLLGAIDDGYGRWARGFFPEPIHPNAAGHTEMFHAFVPTLFDALAAGKPTPTRSAADGFVRVRGRGRSPLTLNVDQTMRSFGLTFQVRAEGDGTIASVGGQTVGHEVDWVTVPFRRAELDFEAMTLTPTGRRFQATIAIQNGRWVYTSANGNAATSPQPGADGQWHHVTLTHYVARGQTHFFVDGRLVGTIDERLQPDRFVLGGPGPDWSTAVTAPADYKDWMVHRAGLNADEVGVLHGGGLLQSSLELYAPLSDDRFDNRAQSLSGIAVDGRAVSATTEN
jgi:lysophospholipase L1-like esterase